MLTDNLYTFGSKYEGTLVTLTDDIKLQAIARVLLPVMPGLVRSAYRKNLIGLKAVRKEQHPWIWRGRVEQRQDRRGSSAHAGAIVGNDHDEPPDVNPTGGGLTRLAAVASVGADGRPEPVWLVQPRMAVAMRK